MRLALRRGHRPVAGSDDAAVSTRLVRRSPAVAVVVVGHGLSVVQVGPRGGHVEGPLDLLELLQLHLGRARFNMSFESFQMQIWDIMQGDHGGLTLRFVEFNFVFSSDCQVLLRQVKIRLAKRQSGGTLADANVT